MSTTAAALTTLAVVLGLPAVWCHGYRTHGRVAAARAERADRVRLERATRPPERRASLEDGVVRVALAAACCERWWTSAGAEHDLTRCTRKDQTT